MNHKVLLMPPCRAWREQGEVLIASVFRSNALDIDDLIDILIENAPLTEQVWRAVKESGINLSGDEIALLESYQNSITSRSVLMDSLRYLKNQKAMNYTDMVHFAINDSSYSLDRVIDSLRAESEDALQFMLVDIYMSQLYEEFDSAETILDNMYIVFKEDSQMRTIKEMELELIGNGETWFDMGSEWIGNLEDFTSYADTTAAIFAAQGILELINDTLYERPYEHMSGTSKRSELSENLEDGIEDEAYQLIPNPLENRLVFVDIGESEYGILHIYTINGVYLGQSQLEQGNNEIDLSKMILSTGVYIYQIDVAGKIKIRDKLIVLN